MPAAPASVDGSAGLAASARALAAGEATSREVVGAALERVAASRETLNAFRLVRTSAARREAAEADRRLDAGERAPLLGVPVAVKDDTETAGDDTRFGTPVDVSGVPGDAGVVTRLRDAGAVIVGKTTTCEFGQWPFTAGAHGTTRNPWSTRHSPGGSSGGSAAAVAAGVVPAAVGSDGAGSIRIPAAWTHLVGVRPGNGAVPIRGGAAGFHGLTVNGPLARSAGDAALLLDVLAGAGGRLRRAARREPDRLRVGVTLRSPVPGVPARPHADVRAAVRQTAGTLAALGHDVVTVRPRWGLIGLSFLPRSLTGVHAWTRRAPDPSRLDARTRENARLGALLRGPALTAALRAVPRLRRRIGRVFDRVDVLLMPTTATPPPPAGAYDGLSGWRTSLRMTRSCPYAWPWNVLGWPGVNVPAGFTAGGLPLGAQLLGPGGSVPRLLGLAGQLEEARPWTRLRPPWARAQSGSSTATVA